MEMEEVSEPDNLEETEFEDYQECDDCEITFFTNQSLKYHMTVFHMQGPALPACYYCKITFVQDRELEHHILEAPRLIFTQRRALVQRAAL